jgi:hypothetical protein
LRHYLKRLCGKNMKAASRGRGRDYGDQIAGAVEVDYLECF